MGSVKPKIFQKAGLSIIEIIVVAALVGVIFTIVISNYREFDRRTVLGNLAHDVSLSVRLAQTYSINVSGEGTSFEKRYGIHFAENTPFSYKLFQIDRSTNSETDIKVYNLNGGYIIGDVCATHGGGDHCFDAGDMTVFDITFDRPKPDSIFTSNSSPPVTYSAVMITITSPTGPSRVVEVFSTGYINVQ